MKLSRAVIAVITSLTFLLSGCARVEGANAKDAVRSTSNALNLELVVGESLLAARAKIIKSGWKPVPMH